MDERLFHPRDFAISIIRCDMKQSQITQMLTEIWQIWRGFLHPNYRINRDIFCREVLYWCDYLCLPEKFHNERDAINEDLKDIDNVKSLFYDDFEPISYAKYLWIRLQFVNSSRYMSILMRTFLKNQGFKRRTSERLKYFRHCLDFYHIQTYRNGELCDLADCELDDRITFRVI